MEARTTRALFTKNVTAMQRPNAKQQLLLLLLLLLLSCCICAPQLLSTAEPSSTKQSPKQKTFAPHKGTKQQPSPDSHTNMREKSSKSSTSSGNNSPSQKVQVSPKLLSRISVIGERHSGTNFMWRLLRTNLASSLNVTDTFCDYKHRYQTPGSHCPDLPSTLVIVMFRNPYDWALAMRENCWCGSDDLAAQVQALTLTAFLQLPWHDSLKRRDEVSDAASGDIAGLMPDQSLVGGGNSSAVDPSTISCDNLLHCRAKKIRNFANISVWAPHVEFVRHEDVITARQSLKWLTDLIARYNLPQSNQTLHPIEHYKRRVKIMFDAESAKMKSLWFNPSAAEDLPALRKYRQDVTRLADRAAEAEAGYILDGQAPSPPDDDDDTSTRRASQPSGN